MTKIICGILTSSNTIKKTSTSENKFKKLKGLQTLDMGCSADAGSFILDYEGDEDVSITEFNDRIVNYYESRKLKVFKYSTKGSSLITFFFQLTRYLQQSIGTVAAIDLNANSTQIGFNLDPEI